MNLFYYGKNILQCPAAEALYVYENIKRFPFFTNPEGLRQDYYMLGKWSNESSLKGNVQKSQLMPILGPANSDPNAPSGPLTHNSKFYIQQKLSEDKNLVEHGADKLESDALLSSKEKQDTDILSLMNTLDVPDDVKDRLAALLKENADVFSEEDVVSQESDLTHLGLEDALVFVHDDL
ncbi:hypothetical protein MEQU1_002488 [Malassezia equina]|uniref:Uncharacterized protein n=1 Tax=Malassezia equina TaxID=1381935 RepID=A0AAF0EEF7_9BASI|nr:hypothetical protein MEQU1_002488 [Malassezia equina]